VASIKNCLYFKFLLRFIILYNLLKNHIPFTFLVYFTFKAHFKIYLSKKTLYQYFRKENKEFENFFRLILNINYKYLHKFN
jgi:hypothetical protein